MNSSQVWNPGLEAWYKCKFSDPANCRESEAHSTIPNSLFINVPQMSFQENSKFENHLCPFTLTAVKLCHKLGPLEKPTFIIPCCLQSEGQMNFTGISYQEFHSLRTSQDIKALFWTEDNGWELRAVSKCLKRNAWGSYFLSEHPAWRC